MFRNSHHAHLTLVAIAAVVLVASPVRGVDFVWSGGGVGDTWFDFANWTPFEFGPPTTFDTATISNGDDVLIDADFTADDQVNALTISGGSYLDTNGFEAVIHDGGTALTLVTGSGSVLRVKQHNSGLAADSFDTDLLTVADGGEVSLYLGGRLEVDSGKLDINTGGLVLGTGAIDLEGSLSSVGTLLENDGELRAGYTLDELPIALTRYVLEINVSDADGRIDLDGTSGNGQVTVGHSSTLDIGAPLADAFSDLISMGEYSRFVMSDAWSADGNSTIDVFAGDYEFPGQPNTSIAGATFTTTGVINVNSGMLVIEPTFNASGATVNVGGQGQDATLQLDGTATLGNLNLPGVGAGTANLTINGHTTVTQGIFNWDDDGLNTTTVGAAGVLTLNVAQLDTSNNKVDSTIDNSGKINVNLTNSSDSWRMDGVLNLGGSSNSVVDRMNGSPMNMTGEMNVAATNVGITADTVFTASSTSNFAASNSYLRMSGETSILAGATFNGLGILANSGDMQLADGADTSSISIQNSGTLSVGDGTGLAHSGPFQNLGEGGTFVVDLDGTTLGTEYDSLDVDGLASLAGTLEVDIDPMFDPMPGDQFTILTYASRNGSFQTVNGAGLINSSVFMALVYDPTELRLATFLAGDGNLDGVVNGLDYLLWAGNFGTHPGPDGDISDGDYNDDGWIDGLDYLVWAGNFDPGDANAVPEPGTFLLLAIATVASLPLRRKNRKHN